MKSEAKSKAAKIRASKMPRDEEGKFTKSVSRKRGRPRGANYYSKAPLPALPAPPIIPAPIPLGSALPPPKRVSRKKEFEIKKDVKKTLNEIDEIIKKAEQKKKRGRPSKPRSKGTVKKTLVMIKELGGSPPSKKRGRPRKNVKKESSGEVREVMAKNGRMMYFRNGKRIKKP